MKQKLLHGIFGGDTIPEYQLAEDEWREVERIAEERYRRWEWNIGRSPRFNVQQSAQLAAGKVDVRIDVKEGMIREIKIYGNFAGSQDVAALEQLLVGVRYEKTAVAKALQDLDITSYLGEVTKTEFLELLT